jgi:hypothetical protein
MKTERHPEKEIGTGKLCAGVVALIVICAFLSVGLWTLPLNYMVGLFLFGIFLTSLCLLMEHYFPAPLEKKKDESPRK